ncbi:MAG: hypothetical protein M1828_005384 [Chrysothrix sp. TS-e1954]|nr:MAG: hypothetical protein M1828_005384 [Chrysothrix sp. TS-e1954]
MAASAAAVVRRALLYVPASSQKFLDKTRTLPQPIDNITYDLEDSVTPAQKAPARAQLLAFLSRPRVPSIRETAVRVNSVDTRYALDDLTTLLKAPTLDAVVVPKVNSAADLHFVADVIRHTLPERHPPGGSGEVSREEGGRGPVRIIALIESAKALMDLNSICAATPLLSGLIFAAEDFALDLSLTRTPGLTEFLYARSAIVTACKAHGLPSAIDLVCTSFRGDEGLQTLEEECANGKRMGFNGKQLIHPTQVEVAQRVFSPSQEELEWAVRCVIADRKADEQGRAAWTLDGKMVDVPVVGKARGVVERARVGGLEVDTVWERWKGQEPE